MIGLFTKEQVHATVIVNQHEQSVSVTPSNTIFTHKSKHMYCYIQYNISPAPALITSLMRRMELHVPHIGVDTLLSHQFIMRALLSY